ncbi:tetratricopeptide repeat protein [Vibrio alfacsensis]|uniref:tetratricopeptide repeat protein n=1 Tax=Vibrio alfacsensis TaxID=1074311 RepID=UPI004068BCBE
MYKGRVLVLATLLLAGCASNDSKQNSFDQSLYAGKPVESLTNDTPPESEAEAIARGDRALSNKNIDLALYEYLRSLTFEESKHKDKTLYTIGRIHQSRGNIELADKAFRASLAENPNHIGVLEQLGKVYVQQGRKDIGLAYYLRAVNADQVRLGRNAGVTKESISSVSVQSLKYDEHSPSHAYVGLGVIFDINGNHELAQQLLRKALDIKPYSENALVSLGYSYYMSEDFGKARHFTNAALRINGDNKKAINNLGLIAVADGQPRQALNIFAQHMTQSEALNSVGYFLIIKEKPDEAIPFLQQAIDKSPSYYAKANENLERALAMVRKGRDTSELTISELNLK